MGIRNKQKNKRVHKGKNHAHSEKVKWPSSNHKKHVTAKANTFPIPFPANVKYPKNGFLRNEAPYEESFKKALETSYEGFVVDQPDIFLKEQKIVKEALEVMEEAGFFRVDVTQPFGLGTKCAKTYVTRCLVGETGTTYKYLGLRMFAHPWNCNSRTNFPQLSSKKISSVGEALFTIGQLNKRLTERTQQHLDNLNRKRLARGANPTRGRACFDISLINRMESSEDLKDEPSMGEGKCSVSWHADSSLEHYSAIAVYQQLSREIEIDNSQWSVGLRVAQNSEGPEASRRGNDITVVDDTPPIAVSLPSNSSYYLLDDFNHHHQHAVIAEGEPSVKRFSSTHRLLRESHNVAHILARCKTSCGGFHKKGSKVWRPEQLLLTEMESEWLRQFYIQGMSHSNLLWKSWGNDIEALLNYWSKLEERTRQTIDFLELAAEGQCGLDKLPDSIDPASQQKSERKLRDKRRKAKDCLQDLIARSGSASIVSSNDVYESMAILLEERAKMRGLWSEREKDGVFHELAKAERPIPIPFVYHQKGDSKSVKGKGFSPMAGSPLELVRIAGNLRKFGAAFLSRNKSDLPPRKSLPILSSTADESHSKSLDWPGWNAHTFGLEMQDPWAHKLLLGEKTIETRAYNLPTALIGKKIEILQSMKGIAGVSAIEDRFDFGNDTKVKVVGWCTFKNVLKYKDEVLFAADEEKHLVNSASGFGWKDGKEIYGWIVDECGLYKQHPPSYSIAVRRMRSLFQIERKVPQKKNREKSQKGSRHRKKRRIRK